MARRISPSICYDLAKDMVSRWDNAVLDGKDEHDLMASYGVTLKQAQQILEAERWQRTKSRSK